MPKPQDRLIVALDYPSAAEALRLVDQLAGQVLWYKVGLELYLAEGPSIVETLRNRGFNIFLDLKLHDIPNTVRGAVRSVSRIGASLLTVHSAGGPKMIEAAVEASVESPDGLKILGVTVLTSMDAAQLSASGINAPVPQQVELLAAMARAAGAPGLICSPLECAQLRRILGPEPLLVVPGIRPMGAAAQDQSRIATPADALRDGASYLVVGRPISQATDPAQAAAAILEEIENAI
jgi:orotidine-5'-phosphate decarboxylase